MKVKARAVVTLEIDLDLDQGWDEECPVSQVFEQAIVDAGSLVIKYVSITPGLIHVRLVGDPKITAILCEGD